MPDENETSKQDSDRSKENTLIDLGRSVVSDIAALTHQPPTSSWDAPHYHDRLLQVYFDLKKRNLLLADLPEWVKQIAIDLEKDDPATADILGDNPRLQEAIAAVTAYTPSKWLLEKELLRRDSTRKERSTDVLVPVDSQISDGSDTKINAEAVPRGKSWSYSGNEDVYEAAAKEKLTGLCFSGGGVRSATFGMGVLQALAELGKLAKVDYLSTVSGGGYIHQWLASWIHNDKSGLAGVQEKLIPLPADHSLARTPEQIRWLRRYSSYLTPQNGIFSADTWTMLAIWFRNTFLNQIVLFSFLASCLLLIRGITYPFTNHWLYWQSRGLSPCSRWGVLFLVLAAIVASSLRLGLALASQTDALKGNERRVRFALGNPGVFCWAVVPGFVLAIMVALEADKRISFGEKRGIPILLLVWAFHLACVALATTFGTRIKSTFVGLKPNAKLQAYTIRPALVVSAILCVAFISFAAWELTTDDKDSYLYSPGKITAAFLNQHLNQSTSKLKVHSDISSDGKPVGTLDLLVPDPNQKQQHPPFDPNNLYITYAPVAIFFLQFLAIRLQLGIIGRYCYESRREWLARFGAWSAMISCGWILMCGISRIGPNVCQWLFLGSTLKKVYGLVTVIMVHAITLYSGASGKTNGKPKPDKFLGHSPLDLVGMVGAPICILSLLGIAAYLLDKALSSPLLYFINKDLRCYGQRLHVEPFLLFLLVISIFLFFGWRVDINEFSLHGFYRNRLARCYLGGNNPKRTPDPFTGFDDHEETGTSAIRLSDLLPKQFGGVKIGEANPRSYDGPFPIFCSTLNLTFGEDLATQERKGTSFAFTPLYSGYHVGWTSAGRKDDSDTTFNGFVPTERYAYPNRGIPLSYATAISGAALSPNQGYNSQPALAFLMTLFNVRLNWWIANPRRRKIWPSSKNSPTPNVGFTYLISELFGLADDTSNYVCLCDGGFFENMGLYELVRRRCSEVVICDAECDENTVFEAIGNAVAKCRADFGVEISLDLTPLIPDPVSGNASSHFVTGSIHYPAPPGDKGAQDKYVGRILYLKTSIVGDETADLLHHRRAFPDFPQDSTADQWFNESQFESYRRLGQLIAERAF
jgi:hypothetical protein